MTTLENVPVKYSNLISDIVTGQVKIPQFQRKFVWDIKSSAELLDSIIKGYPIGTMIYWRTNERLRAVRNIGNIDLPEPKDGEYINYVLDGQQRLTSLFAILKGLKITNDEGKTSDYSEIYVDFNASIDQEIIITDPSKLKESTFIKVTDLMEGGLTLLAAYPSEYHKSIENYKEIIQSYTFPVINLKNAAIDIATEVFTRLNVGGKSLTVFEIMVAKTYDSNREFDLAEKYDEFMEELSTSQFETIPSATVLQVVSILLKKDCTKKQILKLDKNSFIDIWEEAVNSIKHTVDFLKSYGILVSRILPYNALIVPFSYFFHLNKKKPTGEMKKRLEDFFWRASLGFRYSSGVESKLAQDIEKIEKIVKGEHPVYEWTVNITEEYVENNGYFSTGKAFIKSILCLYSKQSPKAFDNNLNVIMDNSWLKISSSKNYHHYFPKSWMKKNYHDLDYFFVNHIVNITIVDDFLNKVLIKTKSPYEYMKFFQETNEELESAMKTHFIDINNDGIWENDYNKFYRNRLKRITKALNKFIIPQKATNLLEVYEDNEEVEPDTV